MTTWAGMGTNGNAAPVARLQAELEQVEGELELARAAIVALVDENADLQVAVYTALRERDSARALVPDTLVCW